MFTIKTWVLSLDIKLTFFFLQEYCILSAGFGTKIRFDHSVVFCKLLSLFDYLFILCMWRSENNMQNLFYSFQHLGLSSRNHTFRL